MPDQNPQNLPPEELYRQPGAYDHSKLRGWWTMHHKLAYVLFGMIFLAIVAGVLYYQNSLSVSEYQAPLHHVNTTDSAASFKTFVNTQYGFEFKYPSELQVNPEIQSTNGLSLMDYFEKNIDKTGSLIKNNVYKENIRSDGLDYIYYTGKSFPADWEGAPPLGITNLIIDSTKSHVIMFSLSGDLFLDYASRSESGTDETKKQQDLRGQILSTFRFTNSNTSANSTNVANSTKNNSDVTNCGVASPTGSVNYQFGSTSGSSGSANVNYDQVSLAAKNCFQQKFSQCLPATYTIDLSSVKYYYEIIGPSGSFCSVKSRFLVNPNPAWINKEMICGLDPKKPFDTAVQDISHCSGDLYNLITTGQ